MSINNISSKVEGLELVMERSFKAPKELVFSAYTEPDLLCIGGARPAGIRLLKEWK